MQTIYVCEKCGEESPKWAGKCATCGAWNSLKELVLKDQIGSKKQKSLKTFPIAQIKDLAQKRIMTEISEMDLVLSGGFVLGTLVLLGGDPGIGKSTLILQAAANVASKNKVLYVSGEESLGQIKSRVVRLGIRAPKLELLAATDIDQIIATAQKTKPHVLILDSIQSVNGQNISSSSGSLIQVKTSALKLQNFAKNNDIPVLIIGHVTKEGLIAGPKTLEHLVDTVMYLEGDRLRSFRILRCTKNRFGSINEVGVFEMTDKGLIQAKKISEYFIEKQPNKIGSVLTVIMEGTRLFVVEIQALAAKTYYGYPQRKSSGFDYNRMQLIIAVLSNILGLRVADKDIYLNIVGGLKIADPAADLACAVAITSAVYKKPIQKNLIVAGEVGLLGEIRQVTQLKRRIKEAQSLGFEKIMIPKIFQDKYLTNKEKRFTIKEVEDIKQAIKTCLVH